MYHRNLKYIRESNKEKQYTTAKIINISAKSYSSYENEDDTLPIKHLNTLANHFNVSIDYIFEFSNNINYKNSKSDINKELSGDRLKEIRKENKLTQDKLAKLLKISRTTITEYERGTNIIATPFLYEICKKYSISADYLLGKTDKPKYF